MQSTNRVSVEKIQITSPFCTPPPPTQTSFKQYMHVKCEGK